MQPTGEYVFYQDTAVLVTNYRVVLFGRTFATNTISSINISEQPANRTPGTVIAATGILLLACGILFAAISLNPFENMSSTIAILGVVVGVAMLIGGMVLSSRAKPKVYLWVGGAYGGSDALLFPDRVYAERVAQMIGMAMTRR